MASEMKANSGDIDTIIEPVEMLECINTAIKIMSSRLGKLSESEILCNGVSGCHKYSTIVSIPNAYVFNSPHQHRMLLTCGKCQTLWKSSFKESQVIQYNCLFCGIDPIDCDKKWFYHEQESISICDECFTSDLTDKFVSLQYNDISNYYVLDNEHTQLINLEPLTKLNIPTEVADKITPDRVSMWFDHIPDITGMDNSMQRIATWLPFTDLVDIPNVKQPEHSSMDDLQEDESKTHIDKKIMLINCNGGQIAKAIVSCDGVVVRVVNDSIQEYGELDINSIINSMGENCIVC
jgi:hypothetical protein